LIIIGIIVFYALMIIFSDITLLIKHFQNFELSFIFLILPLAFCSFFIRGLRWNMLLQSIDISIPLKQSILIYFAGMGLGVTPGRMGEIVKSHILKKDFSKPISKTGPIILVERYYDLVGVILISTIGIWFVNIDKIIIIFALILAISILVLSQRKKIVESVLKKTTKIPFVKKYTKNIIQSYETIQILLRPKIFAKGIVFSISAWGIELLAVYLTFQGFGIDLNFSLIALIFIMSIIMGAISFVPGGIGVTEGGMIGFLLLYGIDYTTASASVLAVRLFTLWFSVIIGIIALKIKI